MTYDLHLLSGFRLFAPNGAEVVVSSKKLQVLIAALAVAHGKPVPRNQLVELLWGDRDETHARNSLRQALTALRKLSGSADISPFKISSEWVSIDPDRLTCDVRQLIQRDCASNLDAELPTGEFLHGLSLAERSVENWLMEQRQRFHNLAVERFVTRITQLLKDEKVSRAASATKDLLTLEPTHEWAHRAAMRCHVKLGDRTMALQQFQTCKARLMDEFGVAPEAATVELHQRIVAGELTADDPIADLDAGDDLWKSVPHDMPSIAVMSFDALSGQGGEENLADGLSKSITLALARFRDLFVIASYSTFAYKGKCTDNAQISRELGVCYMLQGSVQMSGDQVRISVQLIDCVTGGHLWVEHYDREFDDIFAVQDDVTGRIVGSIANGYGGRLRKAWQMTPKEAQPKNFKAFDYFMRGLEFGDEYAFKYGDEAIANFEKALEIDPDYAKPMAKLAWIYVLRAIEGWGANYAADMKKGYDIAHKAMRIDPLEPWCYWILGACRFYEGDQNLGISELEKAHELNPNDADVMFDLGYYKCFYGQAEQGLELALKAQRLNPHHPVWYTMEMIQIYFDARRYKEAIATYGRIQNKGAASCALYCAASHAALGQVDEANKAVAQALEYDPTASISSWTSTRYAPYMHQRDRDHFADNLRKAGLPD